MLLGLFGQLGLPGPLGLLELFNNKSLLKRCHLMVLFGSELRFDFGFLFSVFWLLSVLIELRGLSVPSRSVFTVPP